MTVIAAQYPLEKSRAHRIITVPAPKELIEFSVGILKALAIYNFAGYYQYAFFSFYFNVPFFNCYY